MQSDSQASSPAQRRKAAPQSCWMQPFNNASRSPVLRELFLVLMLRYSQLISSSNKEPPRFHKAGRKGRVARPPACACLCMYALLGVLWTNQRLAYLHINIISTPLNNFSVSVLSIRYRCIASLSK